jgi:hypothetical protein
MTDEKNLGTPAQPDAADAADAAAPRTLKTSAPEPVESRRKGAALGDSIGEFATWLIPSVTALFLAVGYTIQIASRDLLGIEFGDSGTTTYIANAASFFQDVPTIAADQAVELVSFGGLPSLNHHGFQLVIAILLLVCALMLPSRTGPKTRILAPFIAPVVLLVLVAAKFVLFDAPIGKINNVIVGVGIATGGSEPPHAKSLSERLGESKSAGNLQSVIDRLAVSTWSNMVCSRMSGEALSQAGSRSAGEVCSKQEQRVSRADVVGEFLAQSIASLVLIVLATLLLRTGSTGVTALAILVLAYSLTWPFAYGKLIKSTYFEYGLVQMAWPLGDEEGLAMSDRSAARATARGNAEVYAIVLSRTDGGAELLVVKPGKCPRGEQYQETKFWVVSKLQVHVIREIYREDVIAWKTLNERACPTTPAPPTGD